MQLTLETDIQEVCSPSRTVSHSRRPPGSLCVCSGLNGPVKLSPQITALLLCFGPLDSVRGPRRAAVNLSRAGGVIHFQADITSRKESFDEICLHTHTHTDWWRHTHILTPAHWNLLLLLFSFVVSWKTGHYMNFKSGISAFYHTEDSKCPEDSLYLCPWSKFSSKSDQKQFLDVCSRCLLMFRSKFILLVMNPEVHVRHHVH